MNPRYICIWFQLRDDNPIGKNAKNYESVILIDIVRGNAQKGNKT